MKNEGPPLLGPLDHAELLSTGEMYAVFLALFGSGASSPGYRKISMGKDPIWWEGYRGHLGIWGRW